MQADFAIKNAVLVNGTGESARCADIAVRGSRIVDVSGTLFSPH
jgi:N-acyl-D-aspartate/D-glutamate deacylase